MHNRRPPFPYRRHRSLAEIDETTALRELNRTRPLTAREQARLNNLLRRGREAGTYVADLYRQSHPAA